MMQKKLAIVATHFPIHETTRRVGVLCLTFFLSVMLVKTLGVDYSSVTTVLSGWRSQTQFVSSKPDNSQQNETLLDWVFVKYDQNYSSNFISRCLEPRNEPCKDSKTVEIEFLNFDDGKPVVFSTGYAHEVVFRALDESGNVRCFGGDYFEIDLAGEFWKSRPPSKDLGNGSYSFILQVHPDFASTYNLTITLLFQNFEGLLSNYIRASYDKQLRKVPITFSESVGKLPELRLCKKFDFDRDIWTGRWTSHANNYHCEINSNGRYKCLEPEYPCTKPWCDGSLGLLESNGWVYSAHCSFRLFSTASSWDCLDKRWLFFWGDSNHVDTIRNILFFFLGIPFQEARLVVRRFDKIYTNPRNESQSVRITNMFNGHWNETGNHQGLNSLSNEGYQHLLESFFNQSSVPDTVIFNSGLHDGQRWGKIEEFSAAAEYAASFWRDILEKVKEKGLKVSNFIFRSTVATGGFARNRASNPSKMEAYNGILLEKLRATGIVTHVIDDFDMTWAWHFDNRCNDGLHYGRFPSIGMWTDGQIGHQYFVDLMLGHVLLNAICPTV